MAVPRNRVSNAKKKSRRSHHAMKPTNVVKCKCGNFRKSHNTCMSCGKYNDEIISLKD